MTAIWSWVAGKAAGAWMWMAGALIGLGMLLALYAKVFNSGKKAQRASDLDDFARRTRMATDARIEAMRPITPQEEANDPFNRDRR